MVKRKNATSHKDSRCLVIPSLAIYILRYVVIAYFLSDILISIPYVHVSGCPMLDKLNRSMSIPPANQEMVIALASHWTEHEKCRIQLFTLILCFHNCFLPISSSSSFFQLLSSALRFLLPNEKCWIRNWFDWLKQCFLGVCEISYSTRIHSCFHRTVEYLLWNIKGLSNAIGSATIPSDQTTVMTALCPSKWIVERMKFAKEN